MESKEWFNFVSNTHPLSEDLKRRLVDTICLRQQHFAYLRAKWEKAKPKPSDTITAPVITKSALGATFSVTGSISSSTHKLRKKEMIATQIPVPSMMTATTAQAQRVRRERSIQSAVSKEHEEVECSHDNLPLPPKIPLHADEYECPFCYMVCSSGEFSGERWKKHIVQDITPFFCILDACRTPNALYESGRDWVKHMKTEHVQGGWTCMDESHNETLFFNSDSAFKEHMVSCHEDAFSEDELDGIADASYLRVPVDSVINVCPFCPIDTQVNVPTEKIITHVAEHLLSFAQISLSWLMEGEASDLQSSHAWSSQDQPEDSFSKSITPQKGRPNKVVRRVRNLYHGLDELAKERPNKVVWRVRNLYHGLGELAKERVAKRYRYITYGSNVSSERRQPDSPDSEDEVYAIDPEYIPELEDLPDVDENTCNLLWQNVRKELHLPPLDHRPPDSLYAFQVQGTDYNEPHTRDTSTMNLHRPRSRSRSRSSRSKHTLRDAALGAAIGISAISVAKPRNCSQSRSRSPRKSKSRQSSFSQSSYIGIALPAPKSAKFGSSFTASSENRKKRRTKKRKGISSFNISSSSSSSVDDDLVFGSVNARRSPKSEKNGGKKDPGDVDWASPGLSVTASALAPRLTKEQVETLEAQFQAHPKPSSNVKRHLAAQINLSVPRVAKWFQTRRAKAKQEKRLEEFERMQKAKAKAEEAVRNKSGSADDASDSNQSDKTTKEETDKANDTKKSESGASGEQKKTSTSSRLKHHKTRSESAREAAYHRRDQRRGETLAGKDSRSGPYDYTSSATSSEVWEDVDSEGQSSSSVHFAPALGETGRFGSDDSPTRPTAGPESNNRVNRYDNDYLRPIGSQVGNVRRHSESPPQPRMLRRQGSLDTFDRFPSRRIDEDFREQMSPNKSLGPSIPLYSNEFLHLYDHDQDYAPMNSNLFVSLPLAADLASWVTEPIALARVSNGRLSRDIFTWSDTALDPSLWPSLSTEIITDPSINIEGQHPTWKVLRTRESISKDHIVGEITGKIGLLRDYCLDPSNHWQELHHPEPFVFFHPQLPIYIDSRHEGSILRYIRRSCQPNVTIKTYITNEVEYHFCFVAKEDISANSEITVMWYLDPQLFESMHGLVKQEPSDSAQEVAAIRISNVLANFGGCACEPPANCLLASVDRRRHTAVLPYDVVIAEWESLDREKVE
ncbi:hypothetical protein IFM62136_08022 [Aspergillus lentulus]|nr:hypothetical protein IFM62136_08022 [Aspergillus lentulus]